MLLRSNRSTRAPEGDSMFLVGFNLALNSAV